MSSFSDATAELSLNQVYSNSLSSDNAPPMWGELYNYIYQANAAIEGLTASQGVSAVIKQQLIGESKFVRAFCYFYLINLYGDVPLVTSTNYKENQLLPRSPVVTILDLMRTDLKESREALSDTYLMPDGSPATDRVRPNKNVATALLARVYLYQKDWEQAELESSSIVNNSQYELLPDLNNVFVKNNMESIWQLESPNNGLNAPDAIFMGGIIFGEIAYYAPFILSDTLVKNFEPNDLRKANWTISGTINGVDYTFPFKYKLYYTGAPPEEYPVVMRLAEQYLIRAEAKAQQNKLEEALSDLNMIRTRAGLPNFISTSQSDVLDAIVKERRYELFTEYGHRWLDLKRTSKLDAIMQIVTPQKGRNMEYRRSILSHSCE